MESDSHSPAQCVLYLRFIETLHKFAKLGFKRQHSIISLNLSKFYLSNFSSVSVVMRVVSAVPTDNRSINASPVSPTLR